MSFTFMVNPISGGGAGPGAVVPVARALRESGLKAEVVYSPGVQQSVALAVEAVDRGDVVVSVGGDGMLSSLAGAVSAADGVLALVPAGRGNDFARMLGINADTDLVDMLRNGAEQRVDLLSVSCGGGPDRVVAGSVYAGVDAVAGGIVERVRWMPGSVQYPFAAVRALAGYHPMALHVVVDGSPREFRAANVVVANSAYYGSGMKIAPTASATDGLLDVVVIEAASRRSLIRSLPKVYDGSHVNLPEVHVLRGARVELSAETGAPVGADGEAVGELPHPSAPPARVDVLPAALRVLVPRS